MADPHHHAAHDHQRGGGEAELLGAEQRRDHHVSAGLELAVGLHHDPVAQVVEQQRLLGLGQAQLPGRPGVLDRGLRRSAGAAVVARDQHHVRVRLGDSGSHRAHAHLGHQLHVDARLGVGVLEVVDELREILDGVDVVVRRRRDQAHAGGAVTGLGDPRPHLVAGKLAALAGLGALCHLDLDVIGVDQVLAGHPEAPRGGLLDGGAAQVAVGVGQIALGVLAALAGVGLGADAVHGDGQRLVRLGRYRAVAHGAGREALDDHLGRLHGLQRHRRALAEAEAEQAPQGAEPLGLVVDGCGVVLEDVVAAGAGGVLEPEHGLGVEQVVLAFAAPLVLAAGLQRAVRPGRRVDREGAAVAAQHLGCEHVEADPAEAADGAREVLVDDGAAQADRLEDLGACVRGDGADAHLRHHLQHTAAEGLDVVAVQAGDGGGRVQAVLAGCGHVFDGGQGQVRVDGVGAVAQQQADVVHLAGVAALDDQADAGAGLVAHQVVVHGGDGQQARDRRHVAVGAAVADHQDRGAGFYGGVRCCAQFVQGLP